MTLNPYEFKKQVKWSTIIQKRIKTNIFKQ